MQVQEHSVGLCLGNSFATKESGALSGDLTSFKDAQFLLQLIAKLNAGFEVSYFPLLEVPAGWGWIFKVVKVQLSCL